MESLYKKRIIFSVIPAIVILLCHFAYADDEYVHPINKVLMRMYPRPFGLRFPSVPRILATEALAVYKTGEATVIWTGVGGKLVPGGLHLPEGKLIKFVEEKRLEYLKKQLIILY